MRYLGIDYGIKRVGIALSDAEGQMAFPKEVIRNSSDLVRDIAALIERESVDEVVIGHSLNTKGERNTIQEGVDSLILDLTLETGLPVHLEPEWYTTQEATRVQGQTEKKDASAAALILERYLARQSNV